MSLRLFVLFVLSAAVRPEFWLDPAAVADPSVASDAESSASSSSAASSVRRFPQGDVRYFPVV